MAARRGGTGGRRRRGSAPGGSTGPAEAGTATGTPPDGAPVAGGLAVLVPDPDRPRARELRVDGAPQSHVDPDDPHRLVFSYQRRLGHVIDLAAPPGRPLDAVHLGGGALTLPRYLAATRPRSTQQVAEPDVRLTEFVREHLPLPRGARIRVRALDARELLERLPENSADLVVADVFDGARTPAHCTGVEFVDAVRRVLRPTGTLAVNLTDGPPLTHLRARVAAVTARFAEVCLAAEPAVLRGRRFGNAVLAAADVPLPVAELSRRNAAGPTAGRVLSGADLRDFLAGARPLTDADAAASPAPPPGTFG
ncbi:spermidine synthase [Streptomyces sp. ST2-7A]|uniref:spermidine synthase n=1 Tax=Streptomyces sp. ST2-7A TaxID=2907214 RepID=UPI001F34CD24|nr:fused MFS/spermidine synthase [Streptomyces sp. ST2-7A]MCE7081891.1 fused MFS/spermidine synthase [Streptomyces sp. ST2-7A]